MKKIPSSIGKFTISFQVGILAFLLIPALLVIILFILLPEHRVTLVFIVSIIGGVAAIYSAFYAGENLKRTYNYNKKTKTFEMIRQFDQIDFAKMAAFLDTSFNPNDMKQNEIYKKISSDNDLLLAVRSVLNLCEDISIAVQEEYIDEKIAFLSLDQIYRRSVNRFKPFIEGHRLKYGSNEIYIESEKLAHAWLNGRY